MDATARPINSGGFVLEKHCNDKHRLLVVFLGFGLTILGLVLTFALGYIINGEAGRNSKIEAQDSRITDVRIEASAVKSDLATIKEDLRDIKRLLGGLKGDQK